MNATQSPLAAVLRKRLTTDPLRLFAAEVSAIPDAQHVELDIDGTLVVVASLESYSPLVGDTAYVLAQGSLVLAIGAVR